MVRVGILDERAHAYLESWLTADAMKGPDGRKKDYDGRKWYVYYKSTIGTIYGPGAISERQVKPLMDFVGAWENQ